MPFVYPYQLTFEKTTEYFHSLDATKRIHSVNPNMKIIVVMRDPVKRAVSHFTHHLAKLKTKVSEESDEKLTNIFKSLIYDKLGNLKIKNVFISPGRYIEFYKNWSKYFPREQMLVVVSIYRIDSFLY
jgi:hypothetical protein